MESTTEQRLNKGCSLGFGALDDYTLQVSVLALTGLGVFACRGFAHLDSASGLWRVYRFKAISTHQFVDVLEDARAAVIILCTINYRVHAATWCRGHANDFPLL